jgi:hypothetical protein
VLPRLTSISIHRIANIRWNVPERDMSLLLLVEINNSQIHVTIHLNKYAPEQIRVLYNFAFDVARTAVELVAFTKGWGLSVELSKFVGPDGTRELGVLMYENLSPLCTSYDLANGFEEIWAIVQGDKELFGILNDLIASITFPHVSVVNCARAIDGIRNLISTKKNDWSSMHKALRIDTAYLRFISEHSKGPRHGNRGYVDGPTVNIILERSWIVMNRFLEYKKRNCTDLPESEDFPILKG